MKDLKVKFTHGFYRCKSRAAETRRRYRQDSGNHPYPINLPEKFISLMAWLTRKWRAYPIEFSIGTTIGATIQGERKITAIAIVHPRDQFNKKIARKIIRGRIRRQMGLIEGREPYSILAPPNFIHVEEIEVE